MKKRFTRLFGNNMTKRRLSDAVMNLSLPHALLFTGPSGSGKHTLATEIAAAANCLMASDSALPYPCGKCVNCKRIYDGNFPDISFLGKDSGKATIGVEELRDFRENMFLSASESQYKFYVIENADLMTSAAQNALLKVLEEPPKNVHIILLAESADKLLSTIKSRTQYVQMELFEYDELLSSVTELSSTAEALNVTDPERLKAILLASGGVIGKALEMLGDGPTEEIQGKRDLVMSFIQALPKKTPFSKLYAACMALPTKRDELRDVLEEIRIAIRDLIVVKLATDTPMAFFLTESVAEEISSGMNQKRLITVYDIVTSAIEDLDKNVVVATLLTDMAVRIKHT